MDDWLSLASVELASGADSADRVHHRLRGEHAPLVVVGFAWRCTSGFARRACSVRFHQSETGWYFTDRWHVPPEPLVVAWRHDQLLTVGTTNRSELLDEALCSSTSCCQSYLLDRASCPRTPLGAFAGLSFGPFCCDAGSVGASWRRFLGRKLSP